jgi:colanic acid/amylovoran biosynthesis protein
MNILITNMYSFVNKGCEAYAKAIVSEISKIEKEANFRIFTRDPDYDALWMNKHEKVTFLANPFQRWYWFSRLWQYKLAAKLGLTDFLKEGMNAFKWADIVVSTNDIFSSTYGGVFQNLAPIKAALSYKKPVVLIGHSIGPFRKDKELRAFTKKMRNVSLINVRESLTLDYLKKLNLENVRVELTADPAFCLEPETKNLESLWSAYNLPSKEITIGLAPSQGIAYFGETSYAEHFKALMNLIDYLTREFNSQVVLIPHVQDIPLKNNDRVICELLYRKLGFPENVKVLSLSHSAEEIRAIVGRLDVMIAERMHAAIAGLAQNIPTFGIGYSLKAKGILGDIYGFDNIEDYLISVKELSGKALQDRINNLIDNRNKVTQHLSKVIPSIKQKAKRNFTLTMDVLNHDK